MVKYANVIGGASGIGLSIAIELVKRGYKVNIFDKRKPMICTDMHYINFDLIKSDFSILDDYLECEVLVITAGLGRIAYFQNISEAEIDKISTTNSISITKVVRKFYGKINSQNDIYVAVLSSICGIINSPLFSVYSASKAYLFKLIEALNSELEYQNSQNRILCIAPGNIKGTSFYGEVTELSALHNLTGKILTGLFNRNLILIPETEIYLDVIKKYNENSQKFGLDSIKYKINNNRLSSVEQISIGYLSGTFDLFHVGHLNILRHAKSYCDYLVVGVHKDASHKNKETFISFKERCEIVQSIKYVDRVIESFKEDVDAHQFVKYNYLFVGSDYKGSARFERYENFFKDKEVKIIYIPYTLTTSSTQIRNVIKRMDKESDLWEK